MDLLNAIPTLWLTMIQKKYQVRGGEIPAEKVAAAAAGVSELAARPGVTVALFSADYEGRPVTILGILGPVVSKST